MKLYTIEYTATVEVEALNEEAAINEAVELVSRSPLGYGAASVESAVDIEDGCEECGAECGAELVGGFCESCVADPVAEGPIR